MSLPEYMLGFSRDRQQRRGVVLLIVVACIVIAGLSMTGVTRRSLRLATESIEAESELQQRWGTISLQRSLLHAAPKLFADSDKRIQATGVPGPFPSTVRTETLLGGIKFTALLADEQAKLNLNLVYHRYGKATAERLARKMGGPGPLQVHMLPEVESDVKRARRDVSRTKSGANEDGSEIPTPPVAYRHWGQVFDLSNSVTGIAAAQLLPAATKRLTCWGRGEVNIRRAPDDVVEETCRRLLGPGVARKLVARYRKNPTTNLKQIAMQLEVSERSVDKLGQMLTTQSNTYSLWLSSSSLNGTQHWFAVAAPTEDAGIRTERFRF